MILRCKAYSVRIGKIGAAGCCKCRYGCQRNLDPGPGRPWSYAPAQAQTAAPSAEARPGAPPPGSAAPIAGAGSTCTGRGHRCRTAATDGADYPPPLETPAEQTRPRHPSSPLPCLELRLPPHPEYLSCGASALAGGRKTAGQEITRAVASPAPSKPPPAAGSPQVAPNRVQ